MRYAQIREIDISNGEGVGVSLFVQGCPEPHCYNCFNPETWDFNGGKIWDKKIKDTFLDLASKSYINHIGILGGEPLCEENIYDVCELVKECKCLFPNKKIWLWTKYSFEDKVKTLEITKYLDYIIDGTYIDSLKDYRLNFRGSSNQNVWVKEKDESQEEKWNRKM